MLDETKAMYQFLEVFKNLQNIRALAESKATGDTILLYIVDQEVPKVLKRDIRVEVIWNTDRNYYPSTPDELIDNTRNYWYTPFINYWHAVAFANLLKGVKNANKAD